MTAATPVRPPAAAVEGRAGGGAWLPLAAIVLLGAALRFATLRTQSFSDDELFTAWLVRMPFGDMLSTVPQSEATPHLFYVLEWLSVRVFGEGEAGMRVLPALAGTLTIAVVYRAGALAATRRVGLAAAAFAAVNPFLVWYSQEARAYSLLILLAALSLMWALEFERTAGRTALAGWALAGAAALAAHYFAVFLILPAAVWLLAAGRVTLGRRAAAVAVPAVAGLALLPLALHQRDTVGDPGGIGDRALGERILAVPKNFLVGFSLPAETLMVIVAAAAATVALVLAVRSRARVRRTAALSAALTACAVGVPALLALAGLDYFSSRNLVAALVPVAILLACGFAVGRLGATALVVLSAVSVFTVASVASDARYGRRDWRGAAQALGSAREPRVLLVNPPFRNPGPFRIYFGASSRLLGGAPVRVREVALVALTQTNGFGPEVPAPPHGTPAPPRGFALASEVTTGSYRVVRYRAPRPLPLDRRAVAAVGFPGVQSVAVWQAGGP